MRLRERCNNVYLISISCFVGVEFHQRHFNMCRQNSPVHNSAEEEISADESLLIYCKPVEYYNIIYRRFLHNVNYIAVLYLCIDFVI